jgi:hypothetical protein
MEGIQEYSTTKRGVSRNLVADYTQQKLYTADMFESALFSVLILSFVVLDHVIFHHRCRKFIVMTV